MKVSPVEFAVGNTDKFLHFPHYQVLVALLSDWIQSVMKEFMLEDGVPVDSAIRELEHRFEVERQPILSVMDLAPDTYPPEVGFLLREQKMNRVIRFNYERIWEYPGSDDITQLRVFKIKNSLTKFLENKRTKASPRKPNTKDFIIIAGTGQGKMVYALAPNQNALDYFYQMVRHADPR